MIFNIEISLFQITVVYLVSVAVMAFFTYLLAMHCYELKKRVVQVEWTQKHGTPAKVKYIQIQSHTPQGGFK